MWKFVHDEGKINAIALNLTGGQSILRSLIAKPSEFAKVANF
ncbi:hypothetical protein [Turicimonas muris]|nr:hypothetical protein [Turicimonas muris]